MTNFNNPNEMPKEMNFYNWEEFNKFISVEKELKWICLFETLYYCGLRRGELRGLMWRNINFSKKTLTVMQNVVNVKGESGYWLLTTPKTRTSNRKIPICDKLYEDSLKYKKECKQYYGFNDEWFVFGDTNPIHPHSLRMKKNENAEKAGFELEKGCKILDDNTITWVTKENETYDGFNHKIEIVTKSGIISKIKISNKE